MLAEGFDMNIDLNVLIITRITRKFNVSTIIDQREDLIIIICS